MEISTEEVKESKIVGEIQGDSAVTAKRRGRPAGSKNKKKIETIKTVNAVKTTETFETREAVKAVEETSTNEKEKSFEVNASKNSKAFPVVEREFMDLIPPLTEVEYKQLEENLVKNGINDAICTWNNIVIDGHNRLSIAKKHNLPFRTREFDFNNKQEVIDWMIQNQLGRRNITTFDRIMLALKLKPSLEKQAKENQVLAGKANGRGTTQKGLEKSPTAISKMNVRKEIADKAATSEATVRQVITINEKAVAPVKHLLKNQQLSINQACNLAGIEPVIQLKVAGLMESGEKYGQALNIVRAEQKNELLLPASKVLIGGNYDVIYINPSKNLDISIEELKEIQLPVGDSGLLFIWTTPKDIPDTLDLIKSYGFEYQSQIVWAKEDSTHRDEYTKVKHEILMIGRKDHVPAADVKDIPFSVVETEELEDGSKPDIFREIIERIIPPKCTKLEMFSDSKHDSWECWSNLDETEIEEIEETEDEAEREYNEKCKVCEKGCKVFAETVNCSGYKEKKSV